ncbi:MAG: hypothetical protein J5J04_08890 [Anaerolineae bacterium]|nr:hypothetical protein [Chloroflexota bacterium]MBV6436694.1 hypothetical protein [Anaerolineae bacterium]MDL1916245.1 hypothetical protein [Anaerolineae bacterium CFX4]MCO6444182.1 hypothetical protein [Anaerolineae bacterium]NOG51564.1 hypothetical protein [Chloroflexota bacterium]
MARILDETQPTLATAVLAPGGLNAVYWEWAGKFAVRVARFMLYGVDRDEQFIAALTIPHACVPFVRWVDTIHFQYGYALPNGIEIATTIRLPPRVVDKSRRFTIPNSDPATRA